MMYLRMPGLRALPLLLLLTGGCAETATSDTDGAVTPGIDGSITYVAPDGASLPGYDASLPGLDATLPGLDATLPHGDGGVTPPVGDGAVAGDSGSAINVPTAPLPKGEDYKGWTWVSMEGSYCRDGTKAGYFYRLGTAKSLLIYMNGGGACADPFFCGLNPVNVNEDLPIELLIGGATNLLLGPNKDRQVAPDEGVFKKDPRNPVADWNMIYIPYCTGDIHGGYNRDVEVPGVTGKQQFMGGSNYKLFLESFGPSFTSAQQVLLTGSSAGGFGSLINYSRTQDFFDAHGGAKVLAVSDSGIPFQKPYMALCLQKKWRQYWGLNKSFPAECTDCLNEDYGITEALGKYLFKVKFADRKMPGGFISTVNDQIIRAFFAPGQNSTAGGPDDCTLEPGTNTIAGSLFAGGYSGDKYKAGIKDVIDNVAGADRVAYYLMTGENHMHLWRPRFFEKNSNTQSIAEWLADVLAEKPTKQGSF